MKIVPLITYQVLVNGVIFTGSKGFTNYCPETEKISTFQKKIAVLKGSRRLPVNPKIALHSKTSLNLRSEGKS